MITEAISHYRVLRKLGAGGMGEVFLAEDLKLGRKVAIKFLLEKEVEDDVARKRLIREAKSAAALDHPRAFMAGNDFFPVLSLFGCHRQQWPRNRHYRK